MHANRVLVVENSRALASAVAAGLTSIEGIGSDVATTLADARRILDASPGDFFVAVTCLNLPDSPDGEIVDELQARGLRVIVLTAFLDDKRRQRMFERGVADYVLKETLAGIEYVSRAVARMYANRDSCVLVVDDTQTFRDYAGGLLRQHGYRVLDAVDGLDAMDQLAANPDIRLIVTDYEMPRMDGLQMVQEIRRQRSGDDLAIIAVSDSSRSGILARFLKSGCNDFLRKPFSVEEFYCHVDQNIDMLRAIADARRLANRDFLTGLYNRRYFFDHAARMHARARAGEIMLCAAMLDIDHFKRINDTFGHHGGDQALVAVARCLEQQTAASGLIARLGGEEFAYVSIIEDRDQVADCLDDIRRAVASIPLVLDGTPVKITTSIGASCIAGDSIDAMLAMADSAVYEAKQQGRDRVIIT
jgi:diguanylate cyclase (GGDEF)-like protein